MLWAAGGAERRRRRRRRGRGQRRWRGCALLEQHRNDIVRPEDWELLLCTLDDELSVLPAGLGDPTSHPQWLSAASVPEEAAELAFWLGCRLPLTTELRLHLLACACPIKRTRDVVDAMRLLRDPAGQYARARAARGAKLKLLWQTAEASGCELEPPRPVVDWARDGEMGETRY